MASTPASSVRAAFLPILATLLAPFAALAQDAAESDSTQQRKHRRHDLGGATVIGLTEAQEAARQSYNVTAIDAKKLYNTTLDIAHALDRVSGIRVREEGGVGSNLSFSLNGFTGRQVRFFLDGVPMENFGSSFQINNIPINLADRIEIYKGVVPIWLGSDALGGAINIVTGSKPRSFIDLSYSYGSFNTHRTTINAGYTSKSGFTAQLNAFQNYSDNNYWVNVDIADLNTGRYYRDQRVRRFHDRYRNETIIGNIGFVRKKWADQFLIGMTVGQNQKEIQSAARMTVAFGQVETRGNILMPHLRYSKTNLFVKGLDLRFNANYNMGDEQVIDTFNGRYNWFGDYKRLGGSGGERSPSLYKWRNNNALSNATLSYQAGKRHSFMLNHTMNYYDRVGNDPLNPSSVRYEQPQNMTKHNLGLGYKFDFNKAWSTSVFAKQYLQRTGYSLSYTERGTWGDTVRYMEQEKNVGKTGYGIATSYYITPQVQIKGSYERACRMPEFNELFGDLINVAGNYALAPELSDNFNLGISSWLRFGSRHGISVSANAIYRNTRDYIRPMLSPNALTIVNENRDRVTNLGFDAEVRYSFRRVMTLGFTGTYQNLRNKTMYEPNMLIMSAVYNDRMPNMPYFFGNMDASVFLPNVLGKGNVLSLGYNLLYVHAFYLNWPSLGQRTEKYDIPQQLAHDVNLTYAAKDGMYNIALECRNMTDARLYDNFSLQKPSRSFNVKLRYYFSKAIMTSGTSE